MRGKEKIQLVDLQQGFADHIFSTKNQKILQVLPYSKQEALARLDVYRNNVVGNFYAVLSEVFATTKAILKENEFLKLSQKYFLLHSSASGNLDDYGCEFPKLLRRKFPHLMQLAQLELLLHESSFHAAYDMKFDLKKFQQLPPSNFAQLAFSLHPSCFLLKTKFTIFALLQHSNKRSKVVAKPEYIVTYKAFAHKITEAEFIFLTQVQKSKTLYQIYKTLRKKSGEEVDVGKIMQGLISKGWIMPEF